MGLDLERLKKLTVILLLRKYDVKEEDVGKLLDSAKATSETSNNTTAPISIRASLPPSVHSHQAAKSLSLRSSSRASMFVSSSSDSSANERSILTNDEIQMVFEDEVTLRNRFSDFFQASSTSVAASTTLTSVNTTSTSTTTTTTNVAPSLSSTTQFMLSISRSDLFDNGTKEQIKKEIEAFLTDILGKPNILDLLAVAFYLKEKKIIKFLLDYLSRQENLGSAKKWAHIYIIQAFISHKKHEHLERFLKEHNVEILGEIKAKILDHCIEQKDPQALKICLANLVSPQEFFIKTLINRNLHDLLSNFLRDNIHKLLRESSEIMKNAICHCLKQNKPDALIVCLQHLDLNSAHNFFTFFKEAAKSSDGKTAGLLALFFAIAANLGFIVFESSIQQGRFFNIKSLKKDAYTEEWLTETFDKYPALFEVYEKIINQLWPIKFEGSDFNELKHGFLELLNDQLAKYYFNQLFAQINRSLPINPDEESAAHQFDVFIQDCLDRLDFQRLNIVYGLLIDKSKQYLSDLGREDLDKTFWGNEISFGRMGKKLQESSLLKLEVYLRSLDYSQTENVEKATGLIRQAKLLEIFSDAEQQTRLDNLAREFRLVLTSASHSSIAPTAAR